MLIGGAGIYGVTAEIVAQQTREIGRTPKVRRKPDATSGFETAGPVK
jgi:hypothetical protein